MKMKKKPLRTDDVLHWMLSLPISKNSKQKYPNKYQKKNAKDYVMRHTKAKWL